jgi:hypothetical protein
VFSLDGKAMTTIRTFTNQAEASFCASFLQAHEIDAVLLDEGSFAWNFAGAAIPIRLQVPEEQLELATRCLETLASKGKQSDTDSNATPTI